MSETPAFHDNRVEELAEQVRALSAKVDDLTAQLRSLGASRTEMVELPQLDRTSPHAPAHDKAAVSAPIVLSNIALVSFLLVVALVLRTVADNGIVNRELGAMLGAGYAFALIAYGFLRQRRRPVRSVVVVSSAALLSFSIALETHVRFGFPSSPLAYAMLGLTLITVTAYGLRAKNAFPIWIGVLGASLTGIVMDFPHPRFDCMAVLVVLTAWDSYAAIRLPKARGLVWYSLILTLVFWALWTTKVRFALAHGLQTGPGLSLPWLAPAITVMAAGYVVMVLVSVLSEAWSYRKFEACAPVANAVGFYAVMRWVVLPWTGDHGMVQAAVAVAAGVYLVIAAVLAARDKLRHAHAVTGFTLGAAGLVCVSSWAAVGNSAVEVGVWSLSAMFVWLLSVRWRNHDVRAISHLWQTYTCVTAPVWARFWAVPATQTTVCISAALSALCVAQFVRIRRAAPKPAAGLCERLDPADRLAILVLFAGLAYGFVTIRAALYLAIVTLGNAGEIVFQSAQTVTINGCALGLGIIGLRRENRETLAAALIVAGVGAVKVFGYDLTHTAGVPLVISVFSFGVMAAIGSFIWGQWQRRTADTGARPQTDRLDG
ncbi:MAG: hypothetical protein HZB26_14690 [Candidatus Hydrogenedentes bacterium]|nr:hypothetical protein [Candidatus Hydrogenedentota bacterium]